MKRLILFFGIFGCFVGVVNARDLGQWEAVNPEIRQWYQALMQPDVPSASCCGDADAYWADDVHVRDGKTYATSGTTRATTRPMTPPMTGPTNRAAGLILILGRKLRFRTTSSSGTSRIQPVMESYS